MTNGCKNLYFYFQTVSDQGCNGATVQVPNEDDVTISERAEDDKCEAEECHNGEVHSCKTMPELECTRELAEECNTVSDIRGDIGTLPLEETGRRNKSYEKCDVSKIL